MTSPESWLYLGERCGSRHQLEYIAVHSLEAFNLLESHAILVPWVRRSFKYTRRRIHKDYSAHNVAWGTEGVSYYLPLGRFGKRFVLKCELGPSPSTR